MRKWGKNAAVLEFVHRSIRYLAEKHDIIVEGYDIGTIVLPEANIKFYLKASSQARMARMPNIVREGRTAGGTQDAARRLRELDDAAQEMHGESGSAINIDTTNARDIYVYVDMLNRINKIIRKPPKEESEISTLLELKARNPTLKIVPSVGGKFSKCGSGYRTVASWGKARIEQYIVVGGIMVFYETDISGDREALCELLIGAGRIKESLAYSMSVSQLKTMYDFLPWERAIVVDIDVDVEC